uniref:Uncharacterized protein n=1 Tax=Rhizophora mucronata TaxID=61149 RepID=A0A2P2NUV3_RHIMU
MRIAKPQLVSRK